MIASPARQFLYADQLTDDEAFVLAEQAACMSRAAEHLDWSAVASRGTNLETAYRIARRELRAGAACKLRMARVACPYITPAIRVAYLSMGETL